jgi:hypothetical protein
MDPFHFACPHCSSRLRVREKLFVGRHVDCPECGDLLLIVERAGGLGVERVERSSEAALSAVPRKTAAGVPAAPSARPSAPGEPAAPAKTSAVGAEIPAGTTIPAVRMDSGSLRRVLWRRRHSFAALGAAAALGVATLAIVFYPRTPPQDDRAAQPEARPDPNVADRKLPADGHPDPEGAPEGAQNEVERRIVKIGDLLFEQVAGEKSFPAAIVHEPGVPDDHRLGWMAVLADRLDDDSAPAPIWDRPWNDRRNDAFVRRRLAMFQNPDIPNLTGADGYPASHFAGVAGVGADAAKLHPRDARTGIFNNQRATRVEDIRDGASNTLLVMGVSEHLGSWADGGTATVRGLAREPYVNGPDGFGTGSADSMLVLMADGSVRTIGVQTDPRLIRRMAAKADGLALDESEPGEPGDRPSLLAGDGRAAGDLDAPRDREAAIDAALNDIAGAPEPDFDDRPLDPEFAPENFAPVPQIDVAASLKQRIARFDQPRSKPLEDILVSVAEMAGARIAFDPAELGPAAARLAEPMALKLENTTVGDILTGLLRPAGLGFRIEGDHLRVVREE